MTRLAEYYARRAAEYDAVYAKPERQADLAALRELLPPLAQGHRVLEVAAGTGYWTQVMSGSAVAITATDLNAQTLALARKHRYGPAEVSFRIADAYQLADVPGDFDLVFCGFWWSHIRRTDIPRFLRGLRRRLGSGTPLILLDNRQVTGSSQPISRTAASGNTYQQRRLADGSRYEVLKNFPTAEQLDRDLAADARELRWTGLEYYWLATCVLR